MATPTTPLPDGAQPVATPAPAGSPDLTAIQQRLQQQDEALNNLRTAVNNRPVATPPAQPTPPNVQDLEQQFWKEPLNVSAQIANRAAYEAAANTLAPHLDTLVALAKGTVRNQDPALFDRYTGEIEARIAQVHPQFRGNINVWQGIFNAVKGEHTAELLREARESGSSTPRVGDGPAPPTPKAPPAPKVEQLSKDEQEFAKFLGLSDDEYRHGKAILESPDSHWSEVITFDSDEKRRQQRAARNK